MMLTENFIYLCTHFKETSETKMSKPSITLTGILKNLPQRRFFFIQSDLVLCRYIIYLLV